MINYKLPPAVRVLQIRSFLFLWLGQITSQTAFNMMNFILLLHVVQKTNSNTAGSILILSVAVPAVIFGPLAGIYADHVEKRKILFFCNVLRVLLTMVFILNAESIFILYLLVVLASVLTQFFVPAEAPLIPEVVPKNLLLSANGLFTMTLYASIVTGFMLAGPIISSLGVRPALFLVLILFLTATIFVWLLPKTAFLPVSKKNVFKNGIHSFLFKNALTFFLNDFRQGVNYLKNNRQITDDLLILALVQIAVSTLIALAPGYTSVVLGIDIADSSKAIVAPSIAGMITGSVILSFMAPRLNKNKTINLMIFLAGIALSLLSLISRGKLHLDILPLAGWFFFVLGVVNSFLSILANTGLQQDADPKVRSKIYGFLTAVAGLGGVAPILVSGVLADLLGVVKVMFGIGICIVGYGLFRIVNLRRLEYNKLINSKSETLNSKQLC